MSFGVPLSQLIVEKPEPLTTGNSTLDDILGGGFQSGNIYEVYGPPGIGKTRFGINLIKNSLKRSNEDSILWIETFIPLPNNLISNEINNNIYNVKISKFTELLVFFTKLISTNDYKLIIIDGFSQLLVNHLNSLITRDKLSINQGISNKLNIHGLKCRDLILLFSTMTKYANKHNSIIILLNNCMNTSYQTGLLTTSNNINNDFYENTFEVIGDGSNFFVSSTISNNNLNENNSLFNRNNSIGKRNVQMLKSALVANSGMGSKDSKWEIFLRARIALLWDWSHRQEDTNSLTKKSKIPKRTRVAVVCDDLDSRDNKINKPIGQIIEFPINWEFNNDKNSNNLLSNSMIDPSISTDVDSISSPIPRGQCTQLSSTSSSVLLAETQNNSNDDDIVGDSEDESNNNILI
ncbi:similar to Saccharomyces cerevisiae YDR076W RAD55 Protein that stimulates strand exchange by stabilizing the binding of Rad51p to single-stranded DNA [Maudiozyma saulgeensis]|uniref:Similar to Saccharomyces cerevisiae YDR076W RAD55 Protein that stimulates strand exchange by stabilizing the binding of Rad51p to single-stranded DNA n=1 Tax=Maudiozyma saulgeensis TaxID=1789683 RepID=A0A1X7R8H5_9SACH|nr:similar to Saccharomyces cerevisiae YDR076W RAD55 Protein that stimulates strand exchange by stabilizing the binding of Rad51p to single-stranded DNA [Kazachstania saulgeensis]